MKPKFSAKLLSLFACAPLLAAPLAGHADAAMDACIEAFISSTLPEDQPVQVRKNSNRGLPLASRAAPQQIELTARIGRTGEQVATATCIADRNGVIALKRAPSGQRVAGTLEKTAAR